MDASSALRAAGDGTSLDVEVVPGARQSLFPAGFNAWRHRVEARVRAPPEQGEANAELTRLAAAFFGLPSSSVEVVAGHTSRRKTLRLRGLPPARALALLEGWRA